jgi:adenine-specific DNA-methyltransferase
MALVSPIRTHPRSGVRIRYMGNKEALAHEVATVYERRGSGKTLVDLFGGMCNVAGSVSQTTAGQAWVNDVQAYAVLVARCLIASPSAPPARDLAQRVLSAAYGTNLRELRSRFSCELAAERAALRSSEPQLLGKLDDDWRHAANDVAIAREYTALAGNQDVPYRLITLAFACGYFGIRQSIELDSIRYAIDVAERDSRVSIDGARWFRLAWLQAASRIAASPGHFAQFLRTSSQGGRERVAAARRRSAWDHFLHDVGAIGPYGTTRWRRKNRVFHSDALELWPLLDAAHLGPAVFYADPPYSKEHYSRYYHVLETMERYDYPALSGAGRYRPDRFASGFAIKSKVLSQTRKLFECIAARKDAMLLSYPTSGLLTDKLGVDLSALLGEYFADVERVVARDSSHSTLGARHGASTTGVVEYVWWAQ